jgi:hypothetical protein
MNMAMNTVRNVTTSTTIGERISNLREKARVLITDLEEAECPPNRDADEHEEWDTNINIAQGLMSVLESVDDPSPAVAAVVAESTTRYEGYTVVSRAKLVADEIRAIYDAYEKCGIVDADFASELEDLSQWTGDL